MGTLNVSNLNATGNLNLGGSWTDAPIGTIIKRGSYNTGWGTGARTATASTTWSVINVNGTSQAGFGVGKFSDDGLTFEKISNKSHLEITINFPVYVAGNHGGGIRCRASYDGGSNYSILGNLTNGYGHAWGATSAHGTYGAGTLNYTWSTYDNSSVRSNWLGYTGSVRFYFEGRAWDATSTVTYIDYSNDYAKEGTIQVSEIITE